MNTEPYRYKKEPAFAAWRPSVSRDVMYARQKHPEARRSSGPSLEMALQAVADLAQEERLAGLPDGREEVSLRKEPAVRSLTRCLSSGKSAAGTIERFLDNAFRDFRPGETFKHTTLTMIVLIALRDASHPFFDDVAKVFAESTTAEIVSIRRLARRLAREAR